MEAQTMPNKLTGEERQWIIQSVKFLAANLNDQELMHAYIDVRPDCCSRDVFVREVGSMQVISKERAGEIWDHLILGGRDA